jgi:hypothetical protein
MVQARFVIAMVLVASALVGCGGSSSQEKQQTVFAEDGGPSADKPSFEAPFGNGDGGTFATTDAAPANSLACTSADVLYDSVVVSNDWTLDLEKPISKGGAIQSGHYRLVKVISHADHYIGAPWRRVSMDLEVSAGGEVTARIKDAYGLASKESDNGAFERYDWRFSVPTPPTSGAGLTLAARATCGGSGFGDAFQYTAEGDMLVLISKHGMNGTDVLERTFERVR